MYTRSYSIQNDDGYYYYLKKWSRVKWNPSWQKYAFIMLPKMQQQHHHQRQWGKKLYNISSYSLCIGWFFLSPAIFSSRSLIHIVPLIAVSIFVVFSFYFHSNLLSQGITSHFLFIFFKTITGFSRWSRRCGKKTRRKKMNDQLYMLHRMCEINWFCGVRALCVVCIMNISCSIPSKEKAQENKNEVGRDQRGRESENYDLFTWCSSSWINE